MFARIEGPRSDEPLLGMAGRLVDPVVSAGRRRLRFLLTGVESTHLQLEFPVHLRAIARSVGERIGHDADSLFWRTTFVPLYSPFIPQERFVRLRAAMLGDRGPSPHVLLGMHFPRAQNAQWLRFCPRCRDLDIEAHQVAWWRRAHQARGVYLCSTHGIPLCESQFPKAGTWKIDFPAIDDAKVVRQLPPTRDNAFGLAIARDVAWLLSSRIAPREPDDLRSAYFELLKRAGYLRGPRLRRSEFLEEFGQKLREHLQHTRLCYNSTSPYAWPAKLVVGAGSCHPPIQHLFVIHFLGSSVEEFLKIADDSRLPRHPRPTRGPCPEVVHSLKEMWGNPACSINGIARHLGVREQTVRRWATAVGLPLPRFSTAGSSELWKRRVDWYRSRWFERGHLAGGGQSRFARWLRRNDAEWFSRQKITRAQGYDPRVNWPERDRNLALGVERAAQAVRDCRPFRRITLSALAEVLESKGAVLTGAGRLPLFMQAVRSVAEDWRTFALRRAQTVRRDFPNLPGWLACEKAAIPPEFRADSEIRAALHWAPCRVNKKRQH